MNYDAAAKTVRSIWVVIGLILVTLIFMTDVWDWPQMAAVGAMMVGATGATAIVYGITFATIEKFGLTNATTANSFKNKNDRKVRELLSRLTDDEREQLRDRLDDEHSGYAMDDDGEIVQKKTRR